MVVERVIVDGRVSCKVNHRGTCCHDDRRVISGKVDCLDSICDLDGLGARNLDWFFDGNWTIDGYTISTGSSITFILIVVARAINFVLILFNIGIWSGKGVSRTRR